MPDTKTNAHQEKFGCTPTEVGRYIAVPNLMHWLAQFFSAALEKAAAQRGVPPLTIRTSGHRAFSFRKAGWCFLLWHHLFRTLFGYTWLVVS